MTFRLRQKHSRRTTEKTPRPDAARLLANQSVRHAILGGIAAALLVCCLWSALSMNSGKVYPWFSIIMGAVIGFAIRRFGRGFDWRFPVIAAVIACIASYAGNLMIGILETGRYIEATPIEVFTGLTIYTARNFFQNTIGVVDHIYASYATCVAAFFAKRRLNRYEVLAVRKTNRKKND